MNVDESRRDVLAGGVDGRLRRGIAQPPDGDDAPVLHRDIGREPRIAAAVEDAAVTDQEIVGGCRLYSAHRRGRGDGNRESAESGATKKGHGFHRRIVVLIRA